jgi:hypothetical protein
MKKQTLCVGIGLGILAMASMALAGDFHSGITLNCQDCHTMHYSQSHGYNPNGGGSWATLANGPHAYLLRNDINDLCLSCHDNQSWAPDVFESHGNGYVRQAGALNELGGNGLYPEFTGHTLNSTDVAPGSNPAWSNPDGLNCVNCHAAHGSGVGMAANSYRNLGGYGTAVGTAVGISYTRGDVEGANPLTAWVHEDASSGTTGNHYGVGAMAFNEPVSTASAYADVCQGCHTDFHGDVAGTEIGGVGDPPEHFVRHPNLTANIGALGGGHSNIGRFGGKVNQVQVMSPAGKKAGTYLATDLDLTPSCFSCHKGHGNQNAFGLIFMLGTGTINEQGDDGVDTRNMCRQCHGQGGNATTY